MKNPDRIKPDLVERVHLEGWWYDVAHGSFTLTDGEAEFDYYPKSRNGRWANSDTTRRRMLATVDMIDAVQHAGTELEWDRT